MCCCLQPTFASAVTRAVSMVTGRGVSTQHLGSDAAVREHLPEMCLMLQPENNFFIFHSFEIWSLKILDSKFKLNIRGYTWRQELRKQLKAIIYLEISTEIFTAAKVNLNCSHGSKIRAIFTTERFSILKRFNCKHRKENSFVATASAMTNGYIKAIKVLLFIK